MEAKGGKMTKQASIVKVCPFPLSIAKLHILLGVFRPFLCGWGAPFLRFAAGDAKDFSRRIYHPVNQGTGR